MYTLFPWVCHISRHQLTEAPVQDTAYDADMGKATNFSKRKIIGLRVLGSRASHELHWRLVDGSIILHSVWLLLFFATLLLHLLAVAPLAS